MADRKLFVGNLVRRITQDDLWVMYSAFGPLEECAKFHESFGFVRFLYAEDARQALDATHGTILKGRCIKVEFAATTTSWRSNNNNSHCSECRSSRYNIPPIRAVDSRARRGHHHGIVNSSLKSSTPPPIGPIGHRRKVNYELNIRETRHSQTTSSSPPSSYTASSSHITEFDDYDCDLDSGYSDEVDLQLVILSSSSSPPPTTSIYSIPTSPWYDLPIADDLFIWDFQLFTDIAREFLLVKNDNIASETICNYEGDDDGLDSIEHFNALNIEEYL